MTWHDNIFVGYWLELLDTQITMILVPEIGPKNSWKWKSGLSSLFQGFTIIFPTEQLLFETYFHVEYPILSDQQDPKTIFHRNKQWQAPTGVSGAILWAAAAGFPRG